MGPHSASTTMDIESDHEQASLISALSDADAEADEVVARETSSLIGASTLISNATSKSGESYYFSKEPSPMRTSSTPSFHRHSDSLDYSTNSSANSFTNSDNDGESRLSYLGSIMNSLNAQQSFPSSMFPGQKLISPSSQRSKKDLGGEEKEKLYCPSSPRAVSSYYYYETIPYSNNKSLSLPPTYHTTDVSHSNVYQKTHKGFCNDPSAVDTDDDILYSDIDDSRSSSCLRCFFSPRVLLTLGICGILAFNLLRLGGHSHHHHKNAKHYHNRYLPKSGSIQNDDADSADYVNLRARVNGGSNIHNRLGSSSLLRFEKETNNEMDTPLNEDNTGKRDR